MGSGEPESGIVEWWRSQLGATTPLTLELLQSVVDRIAKRVVHNNDEILHLWNGARTHCISCGVPVKWCLANPDSEWRRR